MRSSRWVLLALAVLSALLAAPQALAAPALEPSWSVQPLAAPTNFKAGDESGVARYETFFTNNGGAATDGSDVTILDEVPVGLTVKDAQLRTGRQFLPKSVCETTTAGEASTVTCTVEESLPGGHEPARLLPTEAYLLEVFVSIPPTASGPLVNKVTVEGGGAGTKVAEAHNQVAEGKASAGFQEAHAELTGGEGEQVLGAASHPFQFTNFFGVNLDPAPPSSTLPFVPAGGDLKDLVVELPPGLVGNPNAVPRCTAQQFNTVHAVEDELGGLTAVSECPDASAVGVVNVQQFEGFGLLSNRDPLYNLVPPPGMPAQLGFQVGLGIPVYINTKLRSDGDYGITSYLVNLPQVKRVTAARATIWGVPAAPSHDRKRGTCLYTGNNCPATGADERPFLRLPSSCESPMETTLSFDNWLDPGNFIEASADDGVPNECDRPPFDPTIEAKPTTDVADAPSGLHFDLHFPQEANDDPEGRGEADLREAKVTLPPGLLVNPSSADGLAGCSVAQIGYRGLAEGRQTFSADRPRCPDAAKVGSVEVDTPLIDHPLPGAVYLATPHENPFGSLLAIYITVDDPQSGIVVKLAGEVTPDPLTGQLTTTVKESPQTPFEDFKLDFFEGARAPLRTPATCGTHTTNAALTPWSAPEGSSTSASDSFAITKPPSGGDCPTSPAAEPNNPSFEAGTRAPVAGSYQPFSLKLSRQDGSQELKSLDLALPPGLIGKLAGLAYCPESSLAAAAAKSGRAEQAGPSCPSSSELGTVTVGAGAGPAPFYTKGKAYLAGPYKGAPISMAVITPAVAGPFDLGTVVVRSALQVDPETAVIHAVSDSLPTILQGIPLDVRSIALDIDRSQFTLNPTSCEPFAFAGSALSALGQGAGLSQRFQVGGCQNLPFKPKLSLRLKGGTKRGDHPALTATLKLPPGGANVASAQVALPHSEFLDQAHIRTICTRVQFAASACPKGAIYGFAKAWTPLLDKPLEGPVYLRSSSHELPDLVVDLNGQIHVVLHGRTDSIHGGLRNTFEAVPDAPASKFVLTLQGGKKGLLVNSRDICATKNKATATFTAQSGLVSKFRPVLKSKCGKRKRSARHGAEGQKRGHKR